MSGPLEALAKAEELITHHIGDTPEAAETLRAIRDARGTILRAAVALAESGRIDAREAVRVLEASAGVRS